MHKFIYLFISLLLISCNSQQKVLENKSQKKMEEYYVYQIDTIDDYYLLYAKKGDEIFKIVSKKEKSKKCNLIKLDNRYFFDLYAQSSIKLVIDGKEIAPPVTIVDVMCYNFENGTKICTDRKNGIHDLYYARNLKGLCVQD